MKDETNRGTSSGSVRRRTVVQGTAWAAPAIAVTGVAPKVSASPTPERGLNGWVELSRTCNFNTNRFRVDGRGTYDDRGLWTFTVQTDEPTTATIIFWFDRSTLQFTNASGSGWSNLTRNSTFDSQKPGFYAYVTNYTGAWNYVDAPGTTNDRWEATSDPYWYAENAGCSGQICGHARRTVRYTDGTSVSFDRGPVCV